MDFVKCHWKDCPRAASSSVQQVEEGVVVVRYYCRDHLDDRLHGIKRERIAKASEEALKIAGKYAKPKHEETEKK